MEGEGIICVTRTFAYSVSLSPLLKINDCWIPINFCWAFVMGQASKCCTKCFMCSLSGHGSRVLGDFPILHRKQLKLKEVTSLAHVQIVGSREIWIWVPIPWSQRLWDPAGVTTGFTLLPPPTRPYIESAFPVQRHSDLDCLLSTFTGSTLFKARFIDGANQLSNRCLLSFSWIIQYLLSSFM